MVMINQFSMILLNDDTLARKKNLYTKIDNLVMSSFMSNDDRNDMHPIRL